MIHFLWRFRYIQWLCSMMLFTTAMTWWIHTRTRTLVLYFHSFIPASKNQKWDTICIFARYYTKMNIVSGSHRAFKLMVVQIKVYCIIMLPEAVNKTYRVKRSIRFGIVDGYIVVEHDQKKQRNAKHVCENSQLYVRDHLQKLKDLHIHLFYRDLVHQAYYQFLR